MVEIMCVYYIYIYFYYFLVFGHSKQISASLMCF